MRNYLSNVKRVIKSLIISLLLFSPLMAASPAFAASASLYLSPASSSVSQGSTLSISVRENSGSEPVNGVEIHMTYAADKFDFVSIGSSSAFGIVAANSGGGGSIRIDRGALPAVSGNQLIATLRLRAKVSSGSGAVAITSASRVISANSNANIATSFGTGTYNLTAVPPPTPSAPAPPADKTPPTISKVAVASTTTNSAVITWTTNEPSNSEVDYGLNKSYGLVAVDNANVTDHKVTLNSPIVSPGAQYHFVVKSTDPSGNTASASDGSFETKGAILVVTVLNIKNNKPIKNAKVSINDKSAYTDKNGQATLSGLPLGRLTLTASYKNKQSVAIIPINSIDPSGKPQTATVKIEAPSNLIWYVLIPLILIMLVVAWWLGLEEGQGKFSWRTVKAGLLKMNPAKMRRPPRGPSGPEPPPTIIGPNHNG
jgi:hypothetical protein